MVDVKALNAGEYAEVEDSAQTQSQLRLKLLAKSTGIKLEEILKLSKKEENELYRQFLKLHPPLETSFLVMDMLQEQLKKVLADEPQEIRDRILKKLGVKPDFLG